MPRKTKATPTRTRPPSNLIEGPTPAERLTALEARAAARGYRPMTLNELNEYLHEFRDLWPDPAEIDAFVSWIHRSRRQGQYA